MLRSTVLFLCAATIAWGVTIPRPAPECAILMANGGQVLLSQHKGKVVVLGFISTGCSHCQATTRILSDLQKEYGPRGFQALEAAFNEDPPAIIPLVSEFNARFQPTFPVGFLQRNIVLNYAELGAETRVNLPIILFIDRKRVIRYQYSGGDAVVEDPKQIRATIEKLLNEGSEPASKKGAAKR